MKPLTVFKFVNDQQQKIYQLEEQKADLSLIRKEEIKLDAMGDLMGLLKEWLKYLSKQEDKLRLSTLAYLKEIVED